MTVTREAFLGMALLVGLTTGCAVHESLARPPSPGEVVRINAEAAEHGPLRVEPIVSVGSCAGGGCSAQQMASAASAAGVIEPVRVVASDRDTMTFTNAGGAPMAAPLVAIGGVSTLDRGRGALVGAAVGGATMALLGATGVYLLASLLPNDPGAQPTQSTCDACSVAKLTALFGIEGALVGAGLGALLGSRHFFDFDGRARRPPVFDESTP
jgi:hypothetical protein